MILRGRLYNLSGSFKSQSPSDTSCSMLLDALDQVSISRKFFISLVTYSENSDIYLGVFIFDTDSFCGGFLEWRSASWPEQHRWKERSVARGFQWCCTTTPADRHHLPPSCVFYKFKYEFVARATSERQVCYHRTQRGAYQTPESL